MKLLDLLTDEAVAFNFEVSTKEEAIQKVARLLESASKLNDISTYSKDVQIRENECTTGIGFGIAIPHAKSRGVKESAITFVKLSNPINWDSLDGEPVDTIIMLAVPFGENAEFLELLSKLSYNLMNDEFREKLLDSQSKEEVHQLFETYIK